MLLGQDLCQRKQDQKMRNQLRWHHLIPGHEIFTWPRVMGMRAQPRRVPAVMGDHWSRDTKQGQTRGSDVGAPLGRLSPTRTPLAGALKQG